MDAKATAVTASKQQQQHVGDDHVDGSNGAVVMIPNEAVTAIGELDPCARATFDIDGPGEGLVVSPVGMEGKRAAHARLLTAGIQGHG